MLSKKSIASFADLLDFLIELWSEKRKRSDRPVSTLFVQQILLFQAKKRAACLIHQLGRYSTFTAVKRLLVHPVPHLLHNPNPHELIIYESNELLNGLRKLFVQSDADEQTRLMTIAPKS